MKRLTYEGVGVLRDEISESGKHIDCKEQTGDYSKELLEEAIDKLSEYEDTKLQPEQVEKLKCKHKELQKENRKLKKEILKMLNYAWYNQEDEDE